MLKGTSKERCHQSDRGGETFEKLINNKLFLARRGG